MTLASNITSTAQRLLTKYGQSISVERIDGDFNPLTGATVNGSPTDYTGVGYPSKYNRRDIDGDIVREDDTLLIFSSTTEPKVNDVFTVGSKIMTALSMDIITVSGTTVLYKVQLRQ